MKKIETTIGYRVIENDTIEYFGGQTDNGECYKDLDAWENGTGVIYISEYGLQCDTLDDAWTRETWLEWVKDTLLKEEYENWNDDFVEYLAEIILYECDWQDLSTLLNEIDIYEEISFFNKNLLHLPIAD